MAKLIVYLAFIIYCGAMGAGQMRAMGAGLVADIITDYKADKLWDDDLLMETTQVEESTLTNCDTIEDGKLFLAERPLLLMTNTLNLIK
ncbi:unnamed protein product [Wuchereria bancrofti]|uniref:Uncharacterized protein n=1 Tax=Wuchereria bancrofti TaxID=6293 RepID=A0A3P7EGJ3_WUCBA|nr:unnamed protein product [Wuchereria bancrofti]